MKLIKIDPAAQTIEVIDTAATLHDFFQIIGCRCIDVCARQGDGDALTVDDEALFQRPQPLAFSFGGYGPIHGIAVLSGSDEEGETTEPKMGIEAAKRMVSWLGAAYTAPYFRVTSF
ncbi:DUF3846 domain-containing protein [Larkinella humicola]|uniref:DUF3846 domain-containing protein n=1 Tax=Larkinella humicola TaxID=2607654 RepID=A0A5N1J7P0_9BACT|nr:hypothetical protein [Larkinella humicola]KAA9341197.1 hypothetical protein F0P93_30650 [Larkinella humicola]